MAPAPPDMAEGSARWSDLRLRLASAAVLLPLALFCLFAGGLPWTGLVILAAAALVWEWWRMWWRRPGATPAALLAGWLYMLAGAGALLWLRSDAGTGLGDVLFLLAIVWASDIGAYLAGRLIGGPKLAPAISPGKTWSGAAGGLASAMVVGVLVARAMAQEGSAVAMPGTLLVAAMLSVASQLGDLLESALKRYYGVKDSSRLIPGHGGVFDRLDGVLAAAPLAALLSLLAGPGNELWR